MECPACRRILSERTIGDFAVDVCEGGCGGIWFDWLELSRFEEAHEHLGEPLLGVVRDPSLEVDPKRRRRCPRCEGMILNPHFYSVRRKVEVDACRRCGGFWLDFGELAEIRTLFGSKEERREATTAIFDDLFGEELERMHRKSAEKQGKAQRIARIFRFICPSYYLPGKQTWGAF